MEMYTKDGCIQRQHILEVKAYWAACELILKAEEHPAVKAYLKARKFVEEQQTRAKAKDGPRSLLSKFRKAKVVPTLGRESDESHVETARDGKEEVAQTEQEEKQSNIIYLPFMTPEARACAKACGMSVEAYIKQIIKFANEAVKIEQARNTILSR